MLTCCATLIGLLISSLTAQPTTQPEWRAKFDAVYGLAPDEVLKHIQPPFIDERLEFYVDAMPDQAAAMPAGPTLMTVTWDDSPHIGSCRFSGGGDESGIEIQDLILWLTPLQPYEFEITPELATQELRGDWTLRKGAETANVLTAFFAQVK